MAERSAGKDTTTGHWEMMGVVLDEPFPTYPDGFPPEVIDAFADAIGRGVLGNKPASGTEIIEELGAEHLETGKPIVYTSADSVFQIATHKRVVPLEQLYAWCEQARALLKGEHAVGRVIARPFDGDPGAFTRTKERRDYALPPAGPTVLEALERAGVRTIGVGKIEDIFSRRGLVDSDHTGDNETSIDATVRFLGEAGGPAFVFTNLVDFDMVYGHRRDAEGYARCLERLDARLPEVMADARRRRLAVPHRRPRLRPHRPRHRPHPRVHPHGRLQPRRHLRPAPRRPRHLRRPRRHHRRAVRRPLGRPRPAPSPATSADPPLIHQARCPAGP